MRTVSSEREQCKNTINSQNSTYIVEILHSQKEPGLFLANKELNWHQDYKLIDVLID